MIQQSINRYKRGAKMKTDLRLLMFEKCNRNCDGCCNKDFDLKNLPVETNFTDYDLVMLTGGEPMLNPYLIIDTTIKIRLQNRKVKVVLYTAKIDKPLELRVVLSVLDGITVTLHEQSDVEHFMELSEILKYEVASKSMRVNIFKGVKLNKIYSYWEVKRDIEWVKNCPLPENEVFKRL